MLIIDFNSIKNLNISNSTCYEWAQYILDNKDNVILPKKISIKDGDSRFCNVMPSLIKINDGNFGGIKIVKRYENQNPAIDADILLFDWDTGENLALMDGTWITAMRTGAIAALSINLFANKNFKEVGIIGLGNTMRATISTLLETTDNDKFNIQLLKYKKQEENFIEKYKNNSKVQFSLANSYEELVSNKDVIISAPTYLDHDICKDEYFKEGVTLVPIHTPGFSNCDLFFDKIYSDDLHHISDFKNFKKFKKSFEIIDVMHKKVPGRENKKERILCYNVGLSIYDIYFAYNIYKIISKNHFAENLNIEKPVDKFWVN